jgi:hypothetical protein
VSHEQGRGLAACMLPDNRSYRSLAIVESAKDIDIAVDKGNNIVVVKVDRVHR